ncbi:MAG: DUF2075 domain-containing protein [Ruminococcaceae bacterium]|nr:DUF2075 domain-containing protein [Oscillospiraceae bacterium]
MKNKVFSLMDIIKLSHDPVLSENYVRYLCGFTKQYRHQEIIDIKLLVDSIGKNDVNFDGFIYGYSVPQLNREFDLLKITSSYCLNIELKSSEVSDEKIKHQLLQNLHYLKLINKPNTFAFTFVSSSNKLYTVTNTRELVETSIIQLKNIMASMEENEKIDLDKVFLPANTLVPPLNSPEKFLKREYLLTENQENIKKAIIELFWNNTQGCFSGITGGPGTGKTLLVYDIARDLSAFYKVLIVHSGIICEGHHTLNACLDNIKIIPAKELLFREIRDVDVVIVDEAHRLYSDTFNEIQRWVSKTKALCLFSYDGGQVLSKSEVRMETAKKIEELCKKHVYKLTNKIRTNPELALFITCLRDLTKYRSEYAFPNVRLFYENDKLAAHLRAQSLAEEGYTYISYTPSRYKHKLDYQASKYNTHNVVGQEFEAVCMVLDDNWRYLNGKLISNLHPNPNYLFEQLLYQGLTRVRSKLAIIVCTENLLENIIKLMNCT